MDTDVQSKVKKEDRPLTRTDVEQLLHEAGSPDKLNLSGRNLEGVNLAGLDLHGANLFGADLSAADLHEADLHGATLFGADLYEADLHGADLFGANMHGANMHGASLRGANLHGADLRGADLHGADLHGADLREANLHGANLHEANLSRADLYEAGLYEVNLHEANLHEANLRGAIGLAMESENAEDTAPALHIRITEEPLIAHNFTTTISALTELHTKAWLIQQGRFPDLINYAQTHDIRFTKEANLTIGKPAHNSPTLVELILNPTTLAAGAGAIVTLARALKIAIDNIGQASLRFKEKEFYIKIRRQEAQQAQQTAAQKGSQDGQNAQLEIEKLQLEIERERLEAGKSRAEVALETASKMVDTLRPGIDKETKGMLEQALLPSLLQLSTTKGLELKG